MGYRYLAGNMSSDRPRMLRSHMMMCEQVLARSAELRPALMGGLRNYGVWLLHDALSTQHYRQVLPLWLMLLRIHPLAAARMMLTHIPLAPLRAVRSGWRERFGRRVDVVDVALGRPFLTE